MYISRIIFIISLLTGFLFLHPNRAFACSYKATFSGDTMICSGASVNYATKTASGHYYRWVVTGGNVISGSGTSSIVVNWPDQGTYSVELMDSTSGCKDSLTKKIRVTLSSATLNAGGYTLNGSASASGKVITLTTTTSQNATAWNKNMISLEKNFDFTFTTNQTGTTSPPADGMTFAIQNSGPTALGGGGSNLGYYGAPSGVMTKSIAIEEDIYLNGFDDSSSSHLSLVKDDNYTPLKKQVNITPTLSNGKNRTLRVTWNRGANLFEVYFDSTKVFSWHNDIVKNVFGGDPNVWFGFTGATGGLGAVQTFTNDTLIYGLPSVIPAKDTVCTGDTTTLTTAAGLAYLWSTGATTRSIKITKPGRYYVYVTDSFGCTGTSASDSVVFVTTPTSSFSTSSLCMGTALSITNNSSPATGLSYSWKFGNGDSSNQKVPLYYYRSPGTYTVSLGVTNSGCKDVSSQSVTIYNTPSGMSFAKSSPFSGQYNTGDNIDPDIMCVGDTDVYQFSCPKGLSNSDYGTKWLITGISFKTPFGTKNSDTTFKYPTSSKNASFRFTPSKKFADSLMVLNISVRTLPGKCDSLITRYIQVRPKAISAFGFSNNCQGAALSFFDSSSVPGVTRIDNWSWDFGDGSGSISQNPQHVYAKPGTYTVTLSAASDAGCTTPVTRTVTQYPGAKAAFGVVPGCQDSAIAFADSSSILSGSVTSWKWSFGDGSASTSQNPSYTYAKSGPYVVKLAVISDFGCKDSVTKSIRILPKPHAAFTYLNACVGSTVYIANTSSDSTSPTSYHWDFGDGSSSNSGGVSHIYKQNGTYRLTLTVTSKAGCTDTLSKMVTPNPIPRPDFFAGNACTGKSVAFSDSSINGSGTVYSWNFGDGKTDLGKNSATSHSYAKAGTYTVLLTITNGYGCSDTESKSTIVSDFPKAGFNASDVCIGNAASFTNTSTGAGNLNYTWNFGDGSKGSTAQNPVYTYKAVGAYTVKLLAASSAGCTDSTTKTLNVNALPVVGKWDASVHNYTVRFTPQDTTMGKYVWYFGTGDSSSKAKPEYTYSSVPAKYLVKLVVTNASGCSASYADSVSVGGTGISQATAQANHIKVYPNPFEDITNISYTLTEKSKVNIAVFDIQGKKVAQLRDGSLEPGDYTQTFDGKKYSTENGVYLLKIIINNKLYTTQLVNMK